jgi:hypothetical protein
MIGRLSWASPTAYPGGSESGIAADSGLAAWFPYALLLALEPSGKIPADFPEAFDRPAVGRGRAFFRNLSRVVYDVRLIELVAPIGAFAEGSCGSLPSDSSNK